ncbi:P-loop containing nucleoside triphosphate hydrolase protein, partial [Aspergillus steynii IBT 23096]
FEVHPGQAVAIVGGNGAGKTTILRLISQLIKHSRGYIQIDGYNTRDLNERSIRSHIGFVPQDPGLVHGLSIRDNLTYGLENDMNLEDVQGLCQQLGLDQHISRFTAGYDTLIGPGVDLSGGQRQLVALARVLLRRPPILLLDEPTSQLDNRAQDRVWQLLKAKGVTMLLTTHRLSFLSDVNEILVLEEGKIIERGSHDVLISGQTYYRDL